MLDIAVVLMHIRFMNEAYVGSYEIQKIGYDANNGQLIAFGQSGRDFVVGVGVFVDLDDHLAWAYGHYHEYVSDALGEFDNRTCRTVWCKG